MPQEGRAEIVLKKINKSLPVPQGPRLSKKKKVKKGRKKRKRELLKAIE